MKEININSIIRTLQIAEDLKTLLRHNWTTGERQESLPDHLWTTLVLLLTVRPHLKMDIDIHRCIELIVFFDLIDLKLIAEDKINDQDYLIELDYKNRHIFDDKALLIDINTRSYLLDIWVEGRKMRSIEAKLVSALREIENHSQHNESNINLWSTYDIWKLSNPEGKAMIAEILRTIDDELIKCTKIKIEQKRRNG